MDNFGFWLFLSILVVCDTWLFTKGYETLFHTHKTPEEKELQQQAIKNRRKAPK